MPEKLIDILLKQRNGKAPHPFLIVENVPTDHAEIGSEAELEFHIENAAPKHLSGVDPSPTGLMFICVHEDENGPAHQGRRRASGLAALDEAAARQSFRLARQG